MLPDRCFPIDASRSMLPDRRRSSTIPTTDDAHVLSRRRSQDARLSRRKDAKHAENTRFLFLSFLFLLRERAAAASSCPAHRRPPSQSATPPSPSAAIAASPLPPPSSPPRALAQSPAPLTPPPSLSITRHSPHARSVFIFFLYNHLNCTSIMIIYLLYSYTSLYSAIHYTAIHRYVSVYVILVNSPPRYYTLSYSLCRNTTTGFKHYVIY